MKQAEDAGAEKAVNFADLISPFETRVIAETPRLALGDTFILPRSEKTIPIVGGITEMKFVARDSFSTVEATAGDMVATTVVEFWGHDLVPVEGNSAQAALGKEGQVTTKGDLRLIATAKCGIGWDPNTPNLDAIVVNLDGSNDVWRDSEGKRPDEVRNVIRALEDRAKKALAFGRMKDEKLAGMDADAKATHAALKAVAQHLRVWENAPSKKAAQAATQQQGQQTQQQARRSGRARTALEALK